MSLVPERWWQSVLYALVLEGFLEGPESGALRALPSGTRLAGLTLQQRAERMARRAGAAIVTCVTSGDALKQLNIHEAGSPTAEDQVLILGTGALTSDAELRALVELARSTNQSVLLACSANSFPIAAVLPTRDLPILRGGGLAELLRQGTVIARHCETDAVHLLTSEAALHAADRWLYSDLFSITDGYVDRVFNRHISRWVTRRIINLPISPNQVTYTHFALGLLAAFLFWQDRYLLNVLGAALFQFSVALDCTDGEVARLKYQFSKLGSWLDVAADNVVTVAVFIAVAHSALTEFGPQLATLLGVSAVFGVVMCVLVVFSMARLLDSRGGSASTLAVTNRLSSTDQVRRLDAGRSLVERVLNEATSRDFSVIVVAFAFAGRLEWFAWLAAVGSHVFWIIFAIIQAQLFRSENAQSP